MLFILTYIVPLFILGGAFALRTADSSLPILKAFGYSLAAAAAMVLAYLATILTLTALAS